jgi:hypothetical protein
VEQIGAQHNVHILSGAVPLAQSAGSMWLGLTISS